MNDKVFDPVTPSFKPRSSMGYSTTGRSLWSNESSSIQFGNSLAETGPQRSNFSSLLQDKGMETPPSEHGHRKQQQQRQTSAIGSGFTPKGLNSAYSTPPREATKFGIRAHEPPSFGNTRDYSQQIAGLLPDDPMETQFSISLEQSPAEVISELKLQLETLITAVMMSSGDNASSGAPTSLQGTDAIEISHRIMTRLKFLREENERLAQLSNGTLAANLEAKNLQLEEENERLRAQLAKM